MKKPLFVAVLAVGVLAVAGARMTSAQEMTVGHVPFAFVANGKAMPAGDYLVIPDRTLQDVLQIVSKDGRYTTFTIFQKIDLGAKEAPAAFQFKKLGGEAVLWRVGVPGGELAELPLTLASPREFAAVSGTEKDHRGND